jgi:hypothetical protein
MAHRILSDQGTLEERISRAFRICTARIPDADEIATLKSFHEQSLASDPEQMKLLLEHYKPVTLDLSSHPLDQLAAAMAVSRVLLNLDETITKH